MKYYTIEDNKKSIFKVFAIYYICMAVFCVIRILASTGILPQVDYIDGIFTFSIQVGILFLLPLVLYCLFLKVKPKFVFESCNFTKMNWRVVFISIGLGVLCFFINIAVSSMFNGMISFFGYRFGYSGSDGNYSIGNFFLQLFLVAVLPALCEEFIHRGVLLQGIKHIGFKKAILISSLCFALLHFNIQQVSYAFVIGLILGFVSVVAKNIWPAIIIHFVNNAISTYLDFASVRGWWLGDFLNNLSNTIANSNMIAVFITCVIVLIVVVALLALLIWLLYKQTIIRKVNTAINKVYFSDEYSIVDTNKPLGISDDEMIKDLLENNTLLNLDYQKMDNPINIVMPKEKSRYKAKPMDMVFLWGGIVLGGLITLFTFIWGLF